LVDSVEEDVANSSLEKLPFSASPKRRWLFVLSQLGLKKARANISIVIAKRKEEGSKANGRGDRGFAALPETTNGYAD
jgi:hypothetical protein